MIDNGITIRRAQHSDLQRLTDIYNQAIRTHRCTGDTEEMTAADREEWFRTHEDERYPIYIGEIKASDGSDIIIGYVHISKHKDRRAFDATPEITYYLDFNYLGKGYGSQLVNFMLEELRKLGYKNVVATLLSCNERSIRLLEKFGFKQWGCMKGIVDFGDGNVYDHLAFGLKL